jgi:hypothetical protein
MAPVSLLDQEPLPDPGRFTASEDITVVDPRWLLPVVPALVHASAGQHQGETITGDLMEKAW